MVVNNVSIDKWQACEKLGWMPGLGERYASQATRESVPALQQMPAA